MAPRDPQDVARLIEESSNGSQAALDTLLPLVYDELHRVARGYLNRQQPGHTLQPTALVNEAYLKLVGQRAATRAARSGNECAWN